MKSLPSTQYTPNQILVIKKIKRCGYIEYEINMNPPRLKKKIGRYVALVQKKYIRLNQASLISIRGGKSSNMDDPVIKKWVNSKTPPLPTIKML
jgi:hypothetical protein